MCFLGDQVDLGLVV